MRYARCLVCGHLCRSEHLTCGALCHEVFLARRLATKTCVTHVSARTYPVRRPPLLDRVVAGTNYLLPKTAALQYVRYAQTEGRVFQEGEQLVVGDMLLCTPRGRPWLLSKDGETWTLIVQLSMAQKGTV